MDQINLKEYTTSELIALQVNVTDELSRRLIASENPNAMPEYLPIASPSTGKKVARKLEYDSDECDCVMCASEKTELMHKCDCKTESECKVKCGKQPPEFEPPEFETPVESPDKYRNVVRVVHNDPWLCQCEKCCEKLPSLSKEELFVGSSSFREMSKVAVVRKVKALLLKCENITGLSSKARRCTIVVEIYRLLYKNQWFLEKFQSFNETSCKKLQEFQKIDYSPANLMATIFMDELFPQAVHAMKFQACMGDILAKTDYQKFLKDRIQFRWNRLIAGITLWDEMRLCWPDLAKRLWTKRLVDC